MTKILIGSPVRQKSEILKEFLLSIENLEKNDLEISFIFIDDNTSSTSSELLEKFKLKNKSMDVIKTDIEKNYIFEQNTHKWTEKQIWKVADFKNKIIKKSIEGNYDFLFLIDSDLVIHQKTLKHLLSLKLDIVSEVFWTKWNPEGIIAPQVWI